ncbi:MAG: hypothetical protein AAF959_14020 [Cyanobacteria bacterium P01_D01_bin.56]
MPDNAIPTSERSVRVNGSVIGSAFITGNNNTVSIQFQQASLTPAQAVDIQAELKALQDLLISFNNPIGLCCKNRT